MLNKEMRAWLQNEIERVQDVSVRRRDTYAGNAKIISQYPDLLELQSSFEQLTAAYANHIEVMQKLYKREQLHKQEIAAKTIKKADDDFEDQEETFNRLMSMLAVKQD